MNDKLYTTEIKKILTPDDIAQWRNLWENAQNANVFNSYEWFETCGQVFQNHNFEFHLCYQNKKLVAILPLQKRYSFGVPILQPVGERHIVDTPFLVNTYDKKLISELLSPIFASHAVVLHKLDTTSVKLLNELFPNIFFTLISVNPYIRLQEDPMNNVSKSTLSKLRGILKKTGSQMDFCIYSGKEETLAQMKTIYEIDKMSSKASTGKDIFSDAENRSLFESICKNLGYYVQIHILYLDKIPVLYEFGFLYKNVFSGFVTAYRADYRKINPGKVMIYHLIKNLQENKVELLDMGGGISSYKMEFTKNYRVLYDAYSSSNIFVLWWWKAINAARRIKQILFPIRHTRDFEFLFSTLKRTDFQKNEFQDPVHRM